MWKPDQDTGDKINVNKKKICDPIQIYLSIPGCQNLPKILQLNCKLEIDRYKIKLLLLLLLLSIHYFTVVGLVAWPLNESEAGVDLVLMETSLLFLCKFLLT